MHGTLPVRATYLTPEKLDLPQEQFNALAWFVDEYDAGKIQDISADAVRTSIFPDDLVPSAFHMDYIHVETDCGTSGCILGWIRHRTPMKPYVSDWHWRAQELFAGFPPCVKAAQARDATVRVLRGEPAWPVPDGA